MVVNDDAALAHALHFALSLEGVNVHWHGDAPAALASPDLKRAECLIVKDRLPSMDGCELTRQVLAQGLTPYAILLTSAATLALRARAAAVGVRLVMEKPILDNSLVEAVLGVLCMPPPVLREIT